MDKMWASFFSLGLMVFAILLVTFARSKTSGWIRAVLSTVAFVILMIALLYGLISMS